MLLLNGAFLQRVARMHAKLREEKLLDGVFPVGCEILSFLDKKDTDSAESKRVTLENVSKSC